MGLDRGKTNSATTPICKSGGQKGRDDGDEDLGSGSDGDFDVDHDAEAPCKLLSTNVFDVDHDAEAPCKLLLTNVSDVDHDAEAPSKLLLTNVFFFFFGWNLIDCLDQDHVLADAPY